MSEKIRNQIHFRIKPEEAVIIEQKASKAELSPSLYCKKMSLEGKVKAPLIDLQAARLLLPQISKIGANVNQIARSLNMGATVAPEAVEDIKTQLQGLVADIWAVILDGKKPKQEQPAQAVEPSIGFDFAEPEEEPEPENESITPVNMPQFTDVSAIPQEEQAKPLVCTSCGETISEKVYDYSMKFHGRPLCMRCQK